MAHRHGLAGKYGKSQASIRFNRAMTILWLSLVVGCTVWGFLVGLFWHRRGAGYGLLVELAVAACFPVVWRLISPFVDQLAKERIKHLRGGQAEALVAWLLEDLDDDWHVFNAIKLTPDSDIDHVLVGPPGVFCISTKSTRGLFSGTADGLLHNSAPSPFAQDALRQTMDLRNRLNALLGADVPWVQPVLALPFAWIDRDTACGAKVWLVHQETLLNRLAPDSARKRIPAPHRDRIVHALDMLQTTAAKAYRRASPPASPNDRPQPAV